jgi:hypothetical protein
MILLGCDSPSVKADSIFNLYDTKKEGSLSIPHFKELLDHLYFLVLYALPSMIDKRDEVLGVSMHK